jgi:hypothetical protein
VKVLRIPISLDVTPYDLVDKYQRFRGSYCLYLQGTTFHIAFIFRGQLLYTLSSVLKISPALKL